MQAACECYEDRRDIAEYPTLFLKPSPALDGPLDVPEARDAEPASVAAARCPGSAAFEGLFAQAWVGAVCRKEHSEEAWARQRRSRGLA